MKETGNEQIKCKDGQTDGERERERQTDGKREKGRKEERERKALCRKLKIALESKCGWEIYYLRQDGGQRRSPVIQVSG